MAGRPSALRALMELRVAPELGAFVAAAPALSTLLPRGDGRPVLVLPGFMAGDGSTAPLRAMLASLGHSTHGWGLGRNIGPTDHILDGLVHRLDQLADDGGPVDLVGWSLGGIYARELARIAPQAIRQVVTLGSPFQTEGPGQSNAGAAFAALRHRHSARAIVPRLPSWAREPMPVPATSIYTKGDGIVHWHQCLNRPMPNTENVEVRGSHCGLGYNAAALFVIADRLAQRDFEWRPFRAPAALRRMFPRPRSFEARRVALTG